MSHKGLKANSEELRKKYLREERLPTIFCPGCGLGNIIQIFARAIEASGIDPDKLILVSGIGCTARIPGYFNFDSIHTTHGRAIPVATAIKLTNPELTVVVISGDGDLIGIGGNHFMHAVRRNVGVKVICATNFTYGMTGGQNAPTTPYGSFSTSYPWGGSPEDSIDASKLATVAGAPYVVRWTSYQTAKGIKSICKALRKPGFSFIEFITPCPTNFGRRNRQNTLTEMKEWIRSNTKTMKKGDSKTHHEYFVDTRTEKILLGKFHELERKTFEEQWKESCYIAKRAYIEIKKNEEKKK